MVQNSLRFRGTVSTGKVQDENGGLVSCFRIASFDLKVSARFHCVSASGFITEICWFS